MSTQNHVVCKLLFYITSSQRRLRLLHNVRIHWVHLVVAWVCFAIWTRDKLAVVRVNITISWLYDHLVANWANPVVVGSDHVRCPSFGRSGVRFAWSLSSALHQLPGVSTILLDYSFLYRLNIRLIRSAFPHYIRHIQNSLIWWYTDMAALNDSCAASHDHLAIDSNGMCA